MSIEATALMRRVTNARLQSKMSFSGRLQYSCKQHCHIKRCRLRTESARKPPWQFPTNNAGPVFPLEVKVFDRV